MALADFYTSEAYLKKNPDWHIHAAPWKAHSVLQIMKRNHIDPRIVCEIGCGAGEILHILQQHLHPECVFLGYDIAPKAIELAQKRANDRLHFHLVLAGINSKRPPLGITFIAL